MSTWHDAHHLKHALRCIRSVEPVRWREVLAGLRKSKARRARFLSDSRAMLSFRLSCIYEGLKP